MSDSELIIKKLDSMHVGRNVTSYPQFEIDHKLYERIATFYDSENSKFPQLSTSILNQYEKQDPQFCEMHYKNNKIFEITLNNSQKLVCEHIVLDLKNTIKIDECLRQFCFGFYYGNIHTNATRLLDMKQKYDTDNKIIIEFLYDFNGMPVCDYITSTKNIKNEDIIKIIYQLLIALEDFYELGFANYAIRPENILYDPVKDTIKIHDFSVSSCCLNTSENILKYLADRAENLTSEKSKLYLPPEILHFNDPKCDRFFKLSTHFPQNIDIFAFGVTFAELLLLKENIKIPKIRNYEFKSHQKFVKEIEVKLSNITGNNAWLDIIKNCLSFDPNNRFDIPELKSEFEKILKEQNLSNFVKKYNVWKMLDIGKLGKINLNLCEYEGLIRFCEKYLNQFSAINTENSFYAKLLLGISFLHIKDYENSIIFLKEAISGYEKINKIETVETMKALETLADTLLKTRKFEEAIFSIEKAIKINSKLFENETKNLLNQYELLACIYYETQKYDKSLEIYTKCLSISKKLFHENNPLIANILNKMGLVYFNTKKYDLALQNYEKSLEILSKIYGKIHPELLETYQNLIQISKPINRTDLSIEYGLNIIKITSEKYGVDYPKLAESYDFLGESFYQVGDMDHAAQMYDSALKLLSFKPKSDEITAKIYLHNGIMKKDQFDYDIALDYLLKARTIHLKLPNSNKNEDLLVIHKQIGEIQILLGKFKEAFESALNALKIMKTIVPNENELVYAPIFDTISNSLYGLQNYKASYDYSLKSYKLYSSKKGDKSLELVQVYNSLANSLKQLDKSNEAIDYIKKAIEISSKYNSGISQQMAASYNSLASIYRKLKNYDKAAECYEYMIKIMEKICGAQHPDLATSYSNLGQLYAITQKYDQAILNLTKCEKIREQYFSKTHPLLTSLYQNLADIYCAIGNKKKVKEYQAKLPKFN